MLFLKNVCDGRPPVGVFCQRQMISDICRWWSWMFCILKRSTLLTFARLWAGFRIKFLVKVSHAVFFRAVVSGLFSSSIESQHQQHWRRNSLRLLCKVCICHVRHAAFLLLSCCLRVMPCVFTSRCEFVDGSSTCHYEHVVVRKRKWLLYGLSACFQRCVCNVFFFAPFFVMHSALPGSALRVGLIQNRLLMASAPFVLLNCLQTNVEGFGKVVVLELEQYTPTSKPEIWQRHDSGFVTLTATTQHQVCWI